MKENRNLYLTVFLLAVAILFRMFTDKEYTVGIHADVGENTDIKVFVYDGKDTEPYTR